MTPPLSDVHWPNAHRVIRSRFPPIDLFEDIADPRDWELIVAAEAKTNPRVSESVGALDLIPPERRVAGRGASYVMAPFTHASPDRPTRFSRGGFGVYYAARTFETAMREVLHHHAAFMAATEEPAGWTSDFRELIGVVEARLHDVRDAPTFAACLKPDDYSAAQTLGETLRADGASGVVYPSVRHLGGECVGLFWPDIPAIPVQGRHLRVLWDGARVAAVRDFSSDKVLVAVD